MIRDHVRRQLEIALDDFEDAVRPGGRARAGDQVFGQGARAVLRELNEVLAA